MWIFFLLYQYTLRNFCGVVTCEEIGEKCIFSFFLGFFAMFPHSKNLKKFVQSIYTPKIELSTYRGNPTSFHHLRPYLRMFHQFYRVPKILEEKAHLYYCTVQVSRWMQTCFGIKSSVETFISLGHRLNHSQTCCQFLWRCVLTQKKLSIFCGFFGALFLTQKIKKRKKRILLLQARIWRYGDGTWAFGVTFYALQRGNNLQAISLGAFFTILPG